MIENVASVCLGGVIGYLVMYFLTRLTSYTPKVLSALISVMIGGAVVGFLGKLSNSKKVFSYYAIGLAVGVAVYIIFFWLVHGGPPVIWGP